MPNGTRTVRFTPQFIETDAGVLERALQSREQAYLQGLQLATTAQEKFGEAPVAATDLEARDVLARQFSTDIQDIVDKTAGKDYGAAIPQILQRAAEQKRQGFYQQAAKRYARQQEIQKSADALRRAGHRVVYEGELGRTANIDALTGEVSLTGDPIEDYNVTKGTEWSPYVKSRFPSVKNRLDQIIQRKSRIPGQIEIVNKYGADSLSESEWDEILTPEAIAQFGEETTFFLENPGATAADAREFLKRNIKEQFGRDPESKFVKAPEPSTTDNTGTGTGTLPYYTVSGGQKKIEADEEEIAKPLEDLRKAAGVLAGQTDIDVEKEAKRLGIPVEQVEADLAKLSENEQKEYNAALEAFNKMPSFSQYKAVGLTDLQAAEAITKQKQKAAKTRLFPNVFKPWDVETILPAIERELQRPQLSDVELQVKDPESGEITDHFDRDPFDTVGISDILADKDNKLSDIGIDFSTNQLEMRVQQEDKVVDYRLPLDKAIENDQIRQTINMMGNAIKAYNGELGPGVYPVGPNPFAPAYALEMTVNPETLQIEDNIYQIVYNQQGQPVGKRRSNIQGLMSEGIKGIYDAWGKAPEYVKATGKTPRKTTTTR